MNEDFLFLGLAEGLTKQAEGIGDSLTALLGNNPWMWGLGGAGLGGLGAYMMSDEKNKWRNAMLGAAGGGLGGGLLRGYMNGSSGAPAGTTVQTDPSTGLKSSYAPGAGPGPYAVKKQNVAPLPTAPLSMGGKEETADQGTGEGAAAPQEQALQPQESNYNEDDRANDYRQQQASEQDMAAGEQAMADRLKHINANGYSERQLSSPDLAPVSPGFALNKAKHRIADELTNADSTLPNFDVDRDAKLRKIKNDITDVQYGVQSVHDWENTPIMQKVDRVFSAYPGSPVPEFDSAIARTQVTPPISRAQVLEAKARKNR